MKIVSFNLGRGVMKTYVTPIRGKNRGLVGYIYGDLCERSTREYRVLVHYPKAIFPKEHILSLIKNLREANCAEVIIAGIDQ